MEGDLAKFGNIKKEEENNSTLQHNNCIWHPCLNPGGGGHSTFFGRGVRPGFPKWGACEWIIASERGGLWTENFQILGVCERKIFKFGACELKNSKFGGLRVKIWAKIEVNFKFFSQKGGLWTDYWLKWDPCERRETEMGALWTAGEAWKGGIQGRTSPYPFSRSVPPPGF